MATGDDNFRAIQIGGHTIDFDGMHSVVDSGTVDTVTNLVGGTIGEITNVAAGSVIITSGTITVLPEVVLTSGTADIGEIDITSGTINSGTVDLLVAGTVTEVENIAAGTISLVDTVTTVSTVSSVTDVVEVTNLAAGTVTEVENVAAGTLTVVDTVTSVSNIVSGTILSSRSASHDKVDNGKMFSVSDYHTLDSGGTRLVTLSAYGTAHHSYVAISSKGAVTVRILEGGTTTPAATLSAFNLQRNSVNTTNAEWTTGTELTGGTVIHNDYLPGGRGPQSVGAAAADEWGWYYMIDKETCFEAVDASASENIVAINVKFYEEGA